MSAMRMLHDVTLRSLLSSNKYPKCYVLSEGMWKAIFKASGLSIYALEEWSNMPGFHGMLNGSPVRVHKNDMKLWIASIDHES